MTSRRGYPSVARAEELLREAEAMNPGPWGAHSRVVAAAARAIAERDARLEPQRAYVLGLLHDVGRRTGGHGVADVRHVLDGYAFMRGLGFEESARICLTHSFPIKDVDAFASPWSVRPRRSGSPRSTSTASSTPRTTGWSSCATVWGRRAASC